MAPTPVWMTRRRTSVCSTLLERVRQGADGALHVALDDDVELLEPALLDAREEVVERDRAAVRQLLGAQALVALGRPAGGPRARSRPPGSARRRPRRRRGPGPRPAPTGPAVLEGGAGVVGHRPHAAVDVAGHDHVAHVQRAALHEQRGDRAAARVEARLDDRARRLRASGWPCGSASASATSSTVSSRVSMPRALERGDLHELVRAAPVGGDDVALRELLLDPVGVGAGLVHLVDGDHERHLGGARVVDGLDRLRHDAVVGRHHDHGDVGDLGAAGAHGGERLVARGVEEGDLPAVVVHLVGADVLGDAAGLARRDLGGADRVEERRLAVVDVAHHRDHRRARRRGPRRRRRTPRGARPPPRRGRWRPCAPSRRRSARSRRRRATA